MRLLVKNSVAAGVDLEENKYDGQVINLIHVFHKK